MNPKNQSGTIKLKINNQITFVDMSQPMGKIICKSHNKLTEAYNILNTLTDMQNQHLNRFTMMKKKMHGRYTSEETQEDKDKRVKFILKPADDPSNSPVRPKIDNKYT